MCVSHTDTKLTDAHPLIFMSSLFLFLGQEIHVPIAHIKVEVLEVFVEGHDLFLRVGVHPPEQRALDRLCCGCSPILAALLFLKFHLN